MKFSKVIGKIDPKILADAEEKLTLIFIELGVNPDNRDCVSGLGGDPLIFTLVVPAEHVATLNIPTAATDGRRFYWNPNWINGKSFLGARLTAFHEATHALYMHPQRRGGRNPKIWNVAIDYIVNGMAMEDLKIRLKTDEATKKAMETGFGNYLTLEQYLTHIQNPFLDIPGTEHFVPEPPDPNEKHVALPAHDEDRELTEEEKQELERMQQKFKCYFADPNLPENIKSPEKIYNLILEKMPSCPECGKLGKVPNPKSGKGNKGKPSPGKGEKSDEKGDGGQKGEGCGTCSDGIDLLDFGDTVDEHIDSVETVDEMGKRISDAIKTAKQMAGRIPAGLEDELGALTAPKIRWQDFLRSKLTKARQGNSRNDWSRFRTRPLFANLLVPKRTGNTATFGCVLDTSGSMGQADMAKGISELQSLDEKTEGTIVFCDTVPYFDKAKKIRKCSQSELSNLKVCGRGGTRLDLAINGFQENIGKIDFLIVITDGYLNPSEVDNMQDIGVPIYWLITSEVDFKPPIGRVFSLKNT